MGRVMHTHLRQLGLAMVAGLLLASGAAAQSASSGDPALPWMGLRVGPVPEALAAHLPLKHDPAAPRVGLMVLNLVTDGPADVAGLRRYDVIVSVNGKPVTEQMGRFVQTIGQRQPGEQVRLTVLREARRQTVALTLGRSEPALEAQYTYRYPDLPSAVYRERTRVRSAVLRRTGEGWVLEDMANADPALFADLPEDIQEKVRAWVGPVDRLERTAVVQDDASVEIVRRDDGRVTVQRVVHGEDGAYETSKTYESVDQLSRDDPRTFAIYQRIESEPAIGDTEPTASEGSVLARPLEPEFQIEVSVDESDTDETGRIMDTLEEADAYRENIENYDEFVETYREYLIAAQEAGADTDPPQLEAMLEKLAARLQADRPAREFRIQPSGRIELRIRKPAGDLVLIFDSVQELRSRYPRLYEQYQQLTIEPEQATEPPAEPVVPADNMYWPDPDSPSTYPMTP